MICAMVGFVQVVARLKGFQPGKQFKIMGREGGVWLARIDCSVCNSEVVKCGKTRSRAYSQASSSR